MAKKRLKLLKSWEVRERAALRESLHQTELQLHRERAETAKLKRELAAARLLISIQRVKNDPRITTSTSMDEEMDNYVYDIVRNRHVEVLTYEVARSIWQSWKEGT